MTDDVLTFVEGRTGRIRLNRPKAIHALNTAMCAKMLDALLAWRSDTDVEAVLIDHAEGRGFCAGGDIRMIAESGAGDGAAARDFFRVEYQLNHALFTYAKPIVAFMDGITMGGGVGISMPAKFRVATENTRFAMPETGIGLFPDVGGGWYLSRLPGRIGEYLALTGARLNGADCLKLGLATHYMASAKLDEAKQGLIERPSSEIVSVLEGMADVPDDDTILEHRADIDRLFAGDTLEEIIAALAADSGLWAKEQLAILATKSPQAMKVSLHLVRLGRHMPSFEDEMRQEFAVASRVVQRPDFAEGVRAVIVDKDNEPRWQPATIEGVTDHVIDQIFAPLPEDQAWAPA
ncbi:enoyl-CoA hydratase/isomerase family protein [Sphingomonas sp. 7/4-4]|uniref:enoyl-CoA hydratase/isomerase family protein n=1 Tax=Sphingomonas sp. 7/4-4 TaxID=3018446 RepID=UPI0022F4053C|nr:enoyl-CoA hydratase/isomerase family protein [Sphingomonas sp. 7/4-4]WBY09963.1 enoyl-CoA hydratase/isomerase family protein [Sphingomonas sp. 7/4-4]